MNNSLSNLNRVWASMEPRRRAVLAMSVVAAVVALGLLARIVSAPSMALLYSGLDGAAASGVIEGLERQGVAYEVRGDAIYTTAAARDRVRITLAGEGLPAAGAAGYELLDGMSGFGTTAEMFDAAYWRAKEGELARTILASHRVIRARVHIAQTARRPFEAEKPVTASVTVATSSGALGKTQAEAIRYLVASAVSGLSLENVAVIDQESGVILKSGETESKAALGDDAAARAAALEDSVTRLLEARVGAGGAIVEVSVDAARDSQTIRERSLDPTSRVAIHTDTEESTDAAEGEAAGVTVASNLADGDVEDNGDGSTRQAARSRERVNYEVSETVRETVRPAGEVRRITVAVMVDGVRGEGPNGEDGWSPRPAEELETLRELVESAVGYDEARGDKVTIRSLEFTEAPQRGAVATSSFLDALSVNAMALVQIVTLAVVTLLLGLFVIRPLLTRAPPLPPLAPEPAQIGASGETKGATAEIDAPPTAAGRRALLEAAVTEKQDEAIRLIGHWLDGPETKATDA